MVEPEPAKKYRLRPAPAPQHCLQDPIRYSNKVHNKLWLIRKDINIVCLCPGQRWVEFIAIRDSTEP